MSARSIGQWCAMERIDREFIARTENEARGGKRGGETSEQHLRIMRRPGLREKPRRYEVANAWMTRRLR